MRLKTLTLQGFKSFADKTQFEFDDAVTGIVGPNGCGKSNVVDAIKWVLGERSSKSLRGTEMLDVIFAGSAGRKPSGFASVKLTFENPVLLGAVSRVASPTVTSSESSESDGVAVIAAEAATETETEPSVLQMSVRGKRALPIDADVVEVERQLYRDGTSHYLINSSRARLKDIRDLFLDTGIGADAYSIIEQGKVDAMLMASPQERRVIFEEAAGVAKYKQRRIEAQRKLDRTQDNLRTTREQLESTERRLKLVRGQAAKARRFIELDHELRAWRTSLAFEQYDDLRQRLDGLTSRQTDLKDQRDAAAAKLSEVEQLRQDADIKRQEALGEQRKLEQERQSAQHTLAHSQQRREMTIRAAEESRRQIERDQARVTEIQAAAKATETTITDQQESIGALAEQAAMAERTLADANASRATSLATLSDARERVLKKRSDVARIDRERAALTANSEAELRRAEALNEQSERLLSKDKTLEAELVRLASVATESREKIQSLTQTAGNLTTSIADLNQQIAALSDDRRTRTERVNTLAAESLRLSTRASTLKEMDDSRAGFGDAVRAALDQRESNPGFSAIKGTLADSITVESTHAAPVEAALGTLLQSLLVPALAELPSESDLAALPGRVTLLPLSTTSPSAAHTWPEEISSLPADRVLPLRAVVTASASAPHGTDILLNRLLGNTLLVDSIDTALLLSAGPAQGARFVTRSGLVLESDGRILAGPLSQAGEAGGVLARRAELASLTTRITSVDADLASERSGLAAADGEASELSQKLASLQAELSQTQRAAASENNTLDRTAADSQRIDRERSSISAERDQLATRRDKVEQDRLALVERSDSLKRLFEEESSGILSMESHIVALQAASEAVTDTVAAKRVEVGRLAEQLASSRKELARLNLVRDEQARSLRDLLRQVELATSRASEHTTTIAEAEHAITEAQATIQRLAGVVEQCSVRCMQLGDLLSTLTEDVSAARARAIAFERDWNALEIDKRELEVKRETLEERALEDLSLNLPLLYPEYREMMSEGITRIDVPIAVKEIDMLRDTIKKLGSVNLDSISEETTLAKQNDELVRQVADLDDASVKLSTLITQLNEVSKVKFAEVFSRIQDHFGGGDGMFRRLFGGGRAEVRLMPLIKEINGEKVQTDEIDVLESGVEVIAKPPGKEPRSISQLSGGEKTLTAVALLMSIFRSKPSCFCVLDEVDAALDEGNVGRYNQVIRQFTDLSHFIVITHNKRTMQFADRLYGVTMQERGVSKRVSVKFDEVSSDGSISSRTPRDTSASTAAHGSAQVAASVLADRESEVGVAHTIAPEVRSETADADTAPSKLRKAPPKPPQTKIQGALQRALAAMREDTQPIADAPVADVPAPATVDPSSN